METFSTSLKIIPKALAVKQFSRAMEAAARRRSRIVKVLPKGVLPLVTGSLPQVSAVPERGLVSAKPPITFPRYWGILPSRKWGRTMWPVSRKIRALRPTEVGFFAFLVNVVGAPASIPIHIVNGMVKIANNIRAQAEEDMAMGPEDKIKDELLDLKIRYELGEVSEKDYKAEEARLRRRLKDIREATEENAIEEKPQKSGKKKKKG